MNFKVPVPVIVLVLAAIVLSLIIAFRPQRSETASVRAQTIQASGTRLTVTGESINKPVIADTRAKDWHISQISRVEQDGSRKAIVFNDGSRVRLNPLIEQQISGDILTRINYEASYE